MTSGDPLSIDISAEMQRVDSAVTELIKNRDTWDEFCKDPMGCLSQHGFDIPIVDQYGQNSNDIFFTTLGNTQLLEFVFDKYQDFSFDDMEAATKFYYEGLDRGVIQNLSELDNSAAEYLFQDPEAMRKILSLSLDDLNSKSLLPANYTK